MTEFFDSRLVDLILLSLVALLGIVLVVVTFRLVHARRVNARLRSQLSYRRSPRTLQTAGRAVKVVADTAVKMRDRGVSGFLMSSIEDVTRWVREDRSEIVKVAAPDGTVTVFFSDIESSTELNEHLGDKTYVRLLAKHDAVVRATVERHRGHIVKSQGDGFMVVFGEPEAALHAGIAIQRAFAASRGRRLRRTPIRVRIGVHVGSAIQRGGDFFGRNVAMAARVAAQADGGEILASDEVRSVLNEESGIALVETAELELKGFAGLHTLWQVELDEV